MQVFGAGQYAMRCWVKPDQLAKLQVTVPQIIAALQNQNTVNPAGPGGRRTCSSGQQFTYTVRAQGRLVSPEQFGEIVFRANPGWFHAAAERRGADRTGRADLQPERPLQRPARRRLWRVTNSPGSNAVDAAKAFGRGWRNLSVRFPQDLDYTVSLDTTAPSPPA